MGHPSGAVHRWDDHWGRGRQSDSLSREADPSSGHRIAGTTHRSNFQIYDATNILTVTYYLPEAYIYILYFNKTLCLTKKLKLFNLRVPKQRLDTIYVHFLTAESCFKNRFPTVQTHTQHARASHPI